jgi:hypothetical protein
MATALTMAIARSLWRSHCNLRMLRQERALAAAGAAQEAADSLGQRCLATERLVRDLQARDLLADLLTHLLAYLLTMAPPMAILAYLLTYLLTD